MRSVLLLLCVIVLAGCDTATRLLHEPPPPIGAQLTGEEIKSVLSDNSLVTLPERIPPLSLFFAASGEMHGSRSNGYRDSGTWAIKNDSVCGKWNNWYGTLSSCWEVFRNDKRLTLKSVADEEILTTILTAGNVVKR